LFSSVIIGSDGFGCETVNRIHEIILQIGNVVIGDDGNIGASTTIDPTRCINTKIVY
jgi:UDP-3-O-[3-hydroxymyristoyl] glucosamine N-acyltransferase